MNIETYTKEFPKDLAISDLGQTIARLLETETETETEGLFYKALKKAVDAIRLTTCSTCSTRLCGDDWDLLGNKTDECEGCHYDKRFSALLDFHKPAPFNHPHQNL